jgi:hypothetical protein
VERAAEQNLSICFIQTKVTIEASWIFFFLINMIVTQPKYFSCDVTDCSKVGVKEKIFFDMLGIEVRTSYFCF